METNTWKLLGACRAITQGGAQDQYTYCFNVGTDKSKTPMTLNGMTWSVKKTGIDVGTAYSSDDKM